MGDQQPYYTLRTRRPEDGNSMSSADSTYGSSNSPNLGPNSATHDISRVSYHVKHLGRFAQTLEDSASRAFPNRGRSSHRYKNVQALLLHWGSDDLFVLPELEDLDKCLKEDYAFDTQIFSIPTENSHLELMMRIGQLIKNHEAEDTLFIVYYGGHAKIDESRQSTWCATRHPDSPWLQWSAIQTLLERSASDVLILLDCCAGAASATFPNGNSITETISASSWDAIAPDPGRYSFTNALIEVLQEWRIRTFSAAMLHAEVLARLKHPRPITINGKNFEARSTPVHFMMTSNHKAPSIELCRVVPVDKRPPSPPQELSLGRAVVEASAVETTPEDGGASSADSVVESPNEDTPHVMISLALEDDQRLDLKAWEQWLANFPALAKYVKVQGVFKSHSTLLLLSMPVMIWDLLPEDHATSFVAFIRSDNLLAEKPQQEPPTVETGVPSDQLHMVDPRVERMPETSRPISVLTGTTYATYGAPSLHSHRPGSEIQRTIPYEAAAIDYAISHGYRPPAMGPASQLSPTRLEGTSPSPVGVSSVGLRPVHSATSLPALRRQNTDPSLGSGSISRTMILNQHKSNRRTTFADEVPEPPKFAAHVEHFLEYYYERMPLPDDDYKENVASNLGIEPWHVEAWFHKRRERDVISRRLGALKMDEIPRESKDETRMILPGHLNTLLDIWPGQLLLVDLRTPSEFEKSHIYGAINLRVPLKFAQKASFDMLERAFTDEQSRRKFSSWQSSRCMIFYDRTAEFALEYPIADVLLDKFRGSGWEGQCFVLKGNYREFSMSYGKYIVGSNMTQEAKDYVDGLRERLGSRASQSANERRYKELLQQLDNEERVHESTMTPAQRLERTKTLENHQRDLEAEFQRRFPDLNQKAKEVLGSEETPPAFDPAWQSSTPGGSQLRGKDNFEIKAPMVEYLDRGLDKIRESTPLTSPSRPPGHSKLEAEGYFDGHTARPSSGEHMQISRGEGQVEGQVAEEGGLGARAPADAEAGGDDAPRRGGRGGFLKILRRA